MSGTLTVGACQDLPPAKADVRILLADDHALLRRGLREFLRDFLVEDGLTPDIVETTSARHAIDHIRAGTWDLVILDLNLPDMPGLEVLRILKSLRPALPVLVVSIYAEDWKSVFRLPCRPIFRPMKLPRTSRASAIRT